MPQRVSNVADFNPGSRVLTASATGRSVAPKELDAQDGGKPNNIRTTRFTLLNWIPKSLFMQFQRAANVYFSFVCIIVMMPFSPIMPSSTVIPFFGVLLWTALKDMYEDMRRRRDDDAENLRNTVRWSFAENEFFDVAWKDIHCGDIVLVHQDEAIPADCMLLYACSGQAFISTVNLDGETNLKDRRSPTALSAVTEETRLQIERQGRTSRQLARGKTKAEFHQDVKSLAAQVLSPLLAKGLEVSLAEPEMNLTSMEGSFRFLRPDQATKDKLTALGIETPCRVSYDNFLPRGCVLRNIPYMIAIVGFVGKDTKTRLNCSNKNLAKVSNMQVYLNRGVQALVVSLFLFCAYGATYAELAGTVSQETWPSDVPAWIVRFLVYWVILYHIVPISLYVCFEIVKLVLGARIMQDPQMVDPVSGKPAMARTADLVEEMGQVNFVFSDKTGTLTENEMVMARLCVCTKDLGDFRMAKMARAGSTSSLSGSQDEIPTAPEPAPGVVETRRILALPENTELRNTTYWLLLCMATCHSAQVEPPLEEGGLPVYSGSSPDEVAFLDAAANLGVECTESNVVPGQKSTQLTIASQVGGAGAQAVKMTLATVRAEIPFTSERKRMSIVCEHEGQIYVITKGADSIMQPLCVDGFKGADVEHLTQYSKSGLRTLVFASKTLRKDFFEAWLQRWEAADALQEGKQETMDACAAELESGLTFVGITALEDKLQQGVPEAIELIKAAGMRFWVLTGDKTETAIEIVRSCRLFTEDMVLAYLTECTGPVHALELLEAAMTTLQSAETGGLVIDGTFVAAALQTESAKTRLYEAAMASRSCVCCRLSPNQKRRLVEMVKNENGRGITLAIGDGANDVAMIQSAHVGVGIRGKEGNQAMQASDVTISQFRFLVPLLLCHGRKAYRRISVFLCYMLYKHITVALGDVVWGHQCSRAFYGQIGYAEWLSAAYPALLTGLPVIAVLCFDQDLPDDVIPSCPEIYVEGINRAFFNPRVFVIWVLTAIWHGAVVWLVPSLWVGSNDWRAHLVEEGYEPREFWRASCVSFVLCVVFVNIRLMMYAYSPFSKPTIGIMALTMVTLAGTLFTLGETALGDAMQPQIKGIPAEIFMDGKYWMVMVVTSSFLLIDVVVLTVSGLVQPSLLVTAMRRHRAGLLNKPTL